MKRWVYEDSLYCIVELMDGAWMYTGPRERNLEPAPAYDLYSGTYLDGSPTIGTIYDRRDK